MKECKHHWINRGDASLCPECGCECTVWGNFFYKQPKLGVITRFYRGEISHTEVDKLLELAESIER